MTTFNQAIPILPSPDMDETAAFYIKLGFQKVNQFPGYLILSRNGLELHFWHCDERHIAESSGCRFNVTDVDNFYAHCNQLGIVHPNGKLEVKPWGLREFGILDPAGNLIRFAERT